MGNFTPSNGSASEDLLIWGNIFWDVRILNQKKKVYFPTHVTLCASLLDCWTGRGCLEPAGFQDVPCLGPW